MLRNLILAATSLEPEQSLDELFACNANDNDDEACEDEEKNILKDINKIVQCYRQINAFIKTYGSEQQCSTEATEAANLPLRGGEYLRAFIMGLRNIMRQFRATLYKIEPEYMSSLKKPVLHIYYMVKEYESCGQVMERIIKELQQKSAHGCQIMSIMQLYQHYSETHTCATIEAINKELTALFLQHTINWIFCSELPRDASEFFIKQRHCAQHLQTPDALNYDCYQVNERQVPINLTQAWARKVLDIGLLQLVFEHGPQQYNIWQMINRSKYMQKLGKLNEGERGKLNAYDCFEIIFDMNAQINARLAQLVIKQLQLLEQIQRYKDYFLVSNAHLHSNYLQRIEHAQIWQQSNKHDVRLLQTLERAFVQAAQDVAASKGDVPAAAEFTLEYDMKLQNDEQLEDFNYALVYGHISYLKLCNQLKFPLQLIFTPKVLRNYNLLFRFLLLLSLIKRKLEKLSFNSQQQEQLFASKSAQIFALKAQLLGYVCELQQHLQENVINGLYKEFSLKIAKMMNFKQIIEAHNAYLLELTYDCFQLHELGSVVGDLEAEDEETEAEHEACMLQLQKQQANQSMSLHMFSILHICQQFIVAFQSSSNNTVWQAYLQHDLSEAELNFNKCLKQLIVELQALNDVLKTKQMQQYLAILK